MAKHYLSIIRLFEHGTIPYTGDINISRIKKQLNAEFSLNASGFIETDGYVYNKNDVFEELGREDFIQRLPYHIGIWENKSILALLEKNVFNRTALRPEIKKFNNDKNFDEFFSPFFAVPFNTISRALLNEANFNDLGELLLYEDFLQPAERELGFKSIRLFLDENIYLLKNVSEVNLDVTLTKLSAWTKSDWHDFINYLPYEFDSTKNDLVVYLISLTVKIQHSHKKICRIISNELVQLTDLSPDLSDTIENNDRVYKGRNVKQKTGSGPANYWWVIWIILLLIRGLAKC